MSISTQLKSLIPPKVKIPLKYFFLFTATRKIDNLIEKELIQKYLITKEEIEKYKRELQQDKLIYDLLKKEQELVSILKKEYTEKQNTYKPGILNPRFGIYLYILIRKLKPEVAVETGVCNGFSTAFTLLALHKNGKGKLYSIDFPREAGMNYDKGTFLEQLDGETKTITKRVAKDAAAIPKHQRSGWVIPEYLKQRWELILGRSQEKLPELLAQHKEIDFFIHDSEHTFDCMWFEFNEAYRVLREGGILMSDDITWNDSFQKFALEKGKSIVNIGPRLGFFIK